MADRCQDVQFEKRSGWTRAMLKRVSKSYQAQRAAVTLSWGEQKHQHRGSWAGNKNHPYSSLVLHKVAHVF